MTLNEMIIDLQHLVDKGYGEKDVQIYCINCDIGDNYNGATASTEVVITLNGK